MTGPIRCSPNLPVPLSPSPVTHFTDRKPFFVSHCYCLLRFASPKSNFPPRHAHPRGESAQRRPL
jgi:hypothetical protein